MKILQASSQPATLGVGTTQRLVDVVLGPTSKRPANPLRPLVALLLALAIHGALVLAANKSRPSLEGWSAQVALLVHQELMHTSATNLEPNEPPTPPPKLDAPEPPKVAESTPPTVQPRAATTRTGAPSKLAQPTPPPALPAAAADVVAQPEALVDLSATTFVTGSASSYAGGATVGGVGTQKTPGPMAHATRTPSSVESARSQGTARPVTLEAGEWRCPWPEAALSADIYQAFVILRVTVDNQGHAEAAEVLEDPGYGFGPAAVACAKHTRFSPALDSDGKPRRGSSPPIRVRFVR